jgi:hypothetical protein
MGVISFFTTIEGIDAGRTYEIGKKLPSTTGMTNSLEILLNSDQKIKAVDLSPFQQQREWLC